MTTTNLGLTLPTVGASTDTWGGLINTDLGLIDAYLAPGQFKGTATNDSAATGYVGEFVESKVDSPGSTFSAGSGNAQNLTSISLTAGDWDVEGLVNTVGATLSNMQAGINSTSTTQPSAAYINTIASTSANGSVSAPRRRFSLASTTTIYLVFTGFGGSTPTIFGYINARRVR